MNVRPSPWTGWLCLLASLQGCATRYLPAPAMPERTAPAVTAEAPTALEGNSLVTLDSVGEAARVEEVTGRSTVSAGSMAAYSSNHRGFLAPGAVMLETRPLCVTPCTVSLSQGQHELAFAAMDPSSNHSSTTFVTVGRAPSVVRHAMGAQESHVGGLVGAIIMGALGTSALTAGGALALVGDAGSTPSHSTNLAPAGFITMAIGAVLTTAAIIVGDFSRPESQPGTTLQWSPSAPVPPPPPQ